MKNHLSFVLPFNLTHISVKQTSTNYWKWKEKQREFSFNIHTHITKKLTFQIHTKREFSQSNACAPNSFYNQNKYTYQTLYNAYPQDTTRKKFFISFSPALNHTKSENGVFLNGPLKKKIFFHHHFPIKIHKFTHIQLFFQFEKLHKKIFHQNSFTFTSNVKFYEKNDKKDSKMQMWWKIIINLNKDVTCKNK